jgi:hypothetical protein
LSKRVRLQSAGNEAGYVVSTIATALVRHERGAPDRCPSCSSYRLASDYRPEVGGDGAYVTLYVACGWEGTPAPGAEEERERNRALARWRRHPGLTAGAGERDSAR